MIKQPASNRFPSCPKNLQYLTNKNLSHISRTAVSEKFSLQSIEAKEYHYCGLSTVVSCTIREIHLFMYFLNWFYAQTFSSLLDALMSLINTTLYGSYRADCCKYMKWIIVLDRQNQLSKKYEMITILSPNLHIYKTNNMNKNIPYLSWNSGVLCKNSRPGWLAKSSRSMGLKSSYCTISKKGHVIKLLLSTSIPINHISWQNWPIETNAQKQIYSTSGRKHCAS